MRGAARAGRAVSEGAGRILVTGGTGLVGGRLLPRLLDTGRPVRVLTRSPARARLPRGAVPVGWDGRRFEAEPLRGAEAVVHLAGEPLFGGLPTAGKRQRIRESRVASTASLADALEVLPADERPRTLVCASAVGYYGDGGETPLEEDAPSGEGFLASVCRDWEREAARAETSGLRVVRLRSAVVLSRAGGALPLMALPFRLGLGGPLGDGRQWFPWIHVDDLARLAERALEDAALAGPVNAAAPEPVRNETLTRTLARVLHRPALLRVPAFVLRRALGDLAGELLDSRRVQPARARAAGFAFEHATLEDALRAELG